MSKSYTSSHTVCTIDPTARETVVTTGTMHPNMANGNYKDSYIQVNILEPMLANCSRHAECSSRIEPNPDISGPRVRVRGTEQLYLTGHYHPSPRSLQHF